MRGFKVLASSLLLMASGLLAQEIPVGTVIPVMLQTTLDTKKAKVGQKIEARVMQDVLWSRNSKRFEKARLAASTSLLRIPRGAQSPGQAEPAPVPLAESRGERG
jgi:hypothetical protein